MDVCKSQLPLSMVSSSRWVVPGSHRQGVKQKFLRDSSQNPHATKFVPSEKPEFDLKGAVPVPAPPGTLVLIHGALVHYSAPNLSSKPRHAFTLHVIETSPGFAYPESNWLKIPEAGFPTLYEFNATGRFEEEEGSLIQNAPSLCFQWPDPDSN